MKSAAVSEELKDTTERCLICFAAYINPFLETALQKRAAEMTPDKLLLTVLSLVNLPVPNKSGNNRLRSGDVEDSRNHKGSLFTKLLTDCEDEPGPKTEEDSFFLAAVTLLQKQRAA